MDFFNVEKSKNSLLCKSTCDLFRSSLDYKADGFLYAMSPKSPQRMGLHLLNYAC